ncbi:YesL family protein [Alicyclobacillus shizuokensis]|uniref:YesL family protein n=1 Tax=Alicyclobacillus shizuokensis TaxID=392014 RepID=UPI00082B8873|nr:DUF624 domain-containing protein [Alicyclobacillus shizuokensis]MCL6624973.1 DUF624 domain-containing protein [Alicyclobacillus shizuokensis]
MFQLDGFLYRACKWIYNLFLLNLLVLVNCILIITVYPATAAGFAIVRQWLKGNDPPVLRTYYRYYRENFKQSLITGLVMTAVGVILYVDLRIAVHLQSSFNLIVILFFGILTVIYSSAAVSLFPLMVHGYYTHGRLLVTSLKLGLYKFHLTFLNLVCLGALLFVSLRFTFLLFFFFMSVCIFITYWFAERKFAQLWAAQQQIADSHSA